MPTQPQATEILPYASAVVTSNDNDWPPPPSTALAGTRTESRRTCACPAARQPSGAGTGSVRTPGAEVGTTTAAASSPKRPNTTSRSAYRAPVTHTFCPSTRTASPSGRISVRSVDRSLPASGSLNATAASCPLVRRGR